MPGTAESSILYFPEKDLQLWWKKSTSRGKIYLQAEIQQIGARVVEGSVDFIVFFSDPLTAQPHDPDVKALLRIAQVYDIPIANNRATADFMINSTLMNDEYNHKVINFSKNIKDRANTL